MDDSENKLNNNNQPPDEPSSDGTPPDEQLPGDTSSGETLSNGTSPDESLPDEMLYDESLYDEEYEDDNYEAEKPEDTQEPKEQLKQELPGKEEDAFVETRMSFGDHLLELRSCIIKSLYGLVVGFIICLIFGKHILAFVSMPMLVAMRVNGIPEQLQTLSGPEALVTYIKVSLICGVFLASPWIFRQMWGFIAAGLYEKERKYVNVFVPFSAGLFILGGIFFFLVVAPISFNFFIRFTTRIDAPSLDTNPVAKIMLKVVGTLGIQDNNTAEKHNSQSPPAGNSKKILQEGQDSNTPSNVTNAKDTVVRQNGVTEKAKHNSKSLFGTQFTLQKYISLVAVLALAFGLAFQTPLVVLLLGRLSIVSLDTFRSVRKYVLFCIVIVAAILTPPDVVSQVALACPMYLLYEVGLLLLMIWPKRKHS